MTFSAMPKPPAEVVVDLLIGYPDEKTMDQDWEWVDVTVVGDPPNIRRYRPGRWRGWLCAECRARNTCAVEICVACGTDRGPA